MNQLAWHFHRTLIRIKYGFHWRKPIFILKLLRNIIKAKFSRLLGIKKFIFRGVDMAITMKCNFNCDHCFIKRFVPQKKEYQQEMEVEDYKKIAREAIKMGAIVFSFQGGEVFLHSQWEEIIRAFKPTRNHIVITTNGSLLTEELVKKMKNLGVDTVCFSVDSGIAAEHDKFRKHPGSFDKIMKAMKLVKKYRMKVSMNITMFRENLYSEGFKKALKFSKKNKFLIATILGKPLGNWTGQVEVLTSDKDMDYYYKLRKDYPYAFRDNDNNYGKWGCYAVKEMLYITPYGDVFPCPHTHISLGNVREEPLDDIRNKALKVKWYNHYHPICLSGRDEKFLSQYLPLVDKKGIVPARDIFEEYQP